ncbi:hypothetical protein L211DRAFT_835731 [Terfezia boudieri ATCC MYA-4762]|uniref:Ig-like domain-containing protein n=1 Tax=Terfezia boudieri ATCC MYA-4762 TaxID=1051890 RepID=A0A3N4LTZ0_9PEZI|nr:hypothetical protein L211DRAFT_835731 [Terfezia boudieri ATCC MYA-4762]
MQLFFPWWSLTALGLVLSSIPCKSQSEAQQTERRGTELLCSLRGIGTFSSSTLSSYPLPSSSVWVLCSCNRHS